MNISFFQCPGCHHAGAEQKDDAIRCTSCGACFPIVHGVINRLLKPDREVERELQGMLDEAQEKGEPWKSIEELVVRRLAHVATQEEREEAIKHLSKNYYRSTRLSLEQALALVDLGGRKTVLEIGAENEFPFLKPFFGRGMECFALNIHFAYDDPANFSPWATKVAADMNELPFQDESFDVVVASATTHHSPDLDRTISEISRVTRPGGIILLLNDPIHGVAKHLWDKISRDASFSKGGIRHGLIHENEYTIGQYRRSFRKYGLRQRRSLFPAYYDELLMSGKISGVRWSIVAKLMSKIWHVPPLRRAAIALGLPLGQKIIGLEMNVILEKPPSAERAQGK
jgi:SAM-dependent methyltransferase